MAGRNLKGKQKNGANSKFIDIITNMYGTEVPFVKSYGSVEELDLRYINSETTFGEKNPTANRKFLSVIFLGHL